MRHFYSGPFGGRRTQSRNRRLDAGACHCLCGNQGGCYYSTVPPEATRQTPGLYFVGLSDLVSRSCIIKDIFTTNRRAGALWTYVEEQGVGHEVVGSRDLALIFYEEVMSKRLPDDAMG